MMISRSDLPEYSCEYYRWLSSFFDVGHWMLTDIKKYRELAREFLSAYNIGKYKNNASFM